MKKIFQILLIIFFMGIILVVYFNIDIIADYLIRFFINQKEVIINPSNEYKRDYKYKKFTYEEDYNPYNENDIENIYFNLLNNGWDTFTFYCPEEYENCMNDVKLIGENEELISKINNYVNPFNSFLYMDTSMNDYGEISLTVHNIYSDEDIININNEIDKILNELNMNGLSDRDKISKIYNYVIDNTSYDDTYELDITENNSTNAKGALFNKIAVCSGYSDLIALLLDRVNIPNLKISSENHIWNLVYEGNEWKHLDATWGDATTTRKNYRDKFFLINTEELFNLDKEEHNFDTEFYLELK